MMTRTPSYNMKTDLRKGSWSLEEDQKLISYINRYGIWNWSQMPRFAGIRRSGKSSRLRWMNYLKPGVKRGNFSKEEEAIILHFHSLLGNRWSAIASRLPGRTDNEIKNYWHTHLKKRGERAMPKDSNISLLFETDDITNVNQMDINLTGTIESQTSLSFEDHSSPSYSNTSSIDQYVDFKSDYYDVGSPGTIDDLQCFWQQLCPMENLEIITNHQDFSQLGFQDSYHYPISQYDFNTHDFGTLNI